MTDEVSLIVKTSGSEHITTKAPLDLTIAELKTLLANKTGFPEDRLYLVFSGLPLEVDERTLEEYNLKDGSTIHLVLSRESREQSAAPAIDGTSLHNVQPSAEEKMMQEMFDSPVIQQMFDNPGLMKVLFNSNPQMKKILEENPEIRHAMNDPNFMRQMARSMRDPKLRLEMTRNADRMMANVESLPGGFDALERMYRTIQEPMFDALGDASSNTSNTTDTPSTPVDTSVNTQPLPNPWAARPAAPAFPFGAGAGGFPSMNMLSMFSLLNKADRSDIFANMQQPQQQTQQTSQQQGGGNIFGTLTQMMMSNPDLMQLMMSPDLMSGNPTPETRANIQQQMFQQMLSNPQLMAQLTSPEAIQQMSATINNMGGMSRMGGMGGFGGLGGLGGGTNDLAGLASLFGGMAQQGATGTAGMPATGTGAGATGGVGSANPLAGFNNPFLFNPMMYGGSSSFAPQPAANPWNGFAPLNPAMENPTTRYAAQLQQLNEMGFTDDQKNLQALQTSQGNVERAIEILFSS